MDSGAGQSGSYRLAQQVFEGKITWLEKGIVNLVPPDAGSRRPES